ncbi:MAG: hypothetical protein DPW16_10295 [Chloroflexi bacterium]|nr:hypothetical protein [Chloroflexota bacterium]
MTAKRLSILLVATLIMVVAASVVFTPKGASAATVGYNGDLLWETGNTNNGYDSYALEMDAGQSVTLMMLCKVADFDPLIQVYQNGTLVASDDDGHPAGADNPCSASAHLVFAAPVAGSFVVRATTADFVSGTDLGFGTGAYTLVAEGDFLSFGPTAENVPHLGLVMINWGQNQPAFVAPGSSQVIAGSNGADVILPADADSSGYDTYIVTGAASVDGEIWVSIWLGGAAYGWVPLEDVTAVTVLDLPDFPTPASTHKSAATQARPSAIASPSTPTSSPTPAATATQ